MSQTAIAAKNQWTPIKGLQVFIGEWSKEEEERNDEVVCVWPG